MRNGLFFDNRVEKDARHAFRAQSYRGTPDLYQRSRRAVGADDRQVGAAFETVDIKKDRIAGLAVDADRWFRAR